MRLTIFAFALLAAAIAGHHPASAQQMPRTVAALQRHFPASADQLGPLLARATPAAARRAVSEAMTRFQDEHGADIVAAPGARLIALEADHARMLRAIGRQDVGLCAVVGDLGFFGPDALAGPAPAGLDDYGAALVEAAVAGAGRPAPERPSAADLTEWLTVVGRREPAIPVREFLADAALRQAASDRDLCGGAAVMHEAVADLAPDSAARMAAMLIGALML